MFKRRQRIPRLAVYTGREILTDFYISAAPGSTEEKWSGKFVGENVENAQSKTRATLVPFPTENPIQTELVRLNNLYIVFIDIVFYRSRSTDRAFKMENFSRLRMASVRARREKEGEREMLCA